MQSTRISSRPLGSGKRSWVVLAIITTAPATCLEVDLVRLFSSHWFGRRQMGRLLDPQPWMMHTGCAKLLRSVFHLENDESVQELTDLFQIEDVLGRAIGGRIDHGKFRGVHYETVGEKIDLRPFWSRGIDIGKNHDEVVFDFQKHAGAGLSRNLWIPVDCHVH
ncbi:hypothetical protein E1B28_004048 [Marasmius oreades]|uniref:Uncharacterized protein n=1 Tax=Marasmius oreades TaxID=181124 RepID=A0A9P7UXU4_9AGAR|nr:uncharacterized protein E1B28_004048 [Marasmius oreades]KAG7096631.1 hypothetical protein E1B28_004048 [Marasmius oreades]